MQRKYRRSLSAGSNASHSTPHRSSLSPYQNWQPITPVGPARTNSPSPPSRYHPYAHHPRTPPATPDRAKAQMSPQNLPPLDIPQCTPSARSPYSTHSHGTPSTPYSIPPSAGYASLKQLPDIHTVFSSPSPSPSSIHLPPLQNSWTRSPSEQSYSSPRSAPASPTPTTTTETRDEIKGRMSLDSLLI